MEIVTIELLRQKTNTSELSDPELEKAVKFINGIPKSEGKKEAIKKYIKTEFPMVNAPELIEVIRSFFQDQKMAFHSGALKMHQAAEKLKKVSKTIEDNKSENY